MSEKMGAVIPYDGDHDGNLAEAQQGWETVTSLSGKTAGEVFASQPGAAENSGQQEQISSPVEALRKLLVVVGNKVVTNTSEEDANTSKDEDVAGGEQDETLAEEPAIEDEGTGSEKLDKWAESLRGTLEKYWRDLSDREWNEHEVVIGDMPELGDLRDEVISMLKEWSPEIGAEAMQKRVDMATKMALEEYAKRKGAKLAETKPKKSGFLGMDYRRRLPKGFDSDLRQTVRRDARNAFRNIYGSTEVDLTDDAAQNELTEDELIAWKVSSEEMGKARDQRKLSMERLQHQRREGEGADAYIERLGRYTQGGEARNKQLEADAEYEAEHQVNGASEAEVEKVEAEIISKAEADRLGKFEQIKTLLPGDEGTPEGKLTNLMYMKSEMERRILNTSEALSTDPARQAHLLNLVAELGAEINKIRIERDVRDGKSKERQRELTDAYDDFNLELVYRQGYIKRDVQGQEQILQLRIAENNAQQGLLRAQIDLEEARKAEDAEALNTARNMIDDYSLTIQMVSPAMRALERKFGVAVPKPVEEDAESA